MFDGGFWRCRGGRVEILGPYSQDSFQNFFTRTDGGQHGWGLFCDAREELPVRGRIQRRVERKQRQADPMVMALNHCLLRQFKYKRQVGQGALFEFFLVSDQETRQICPRGAGGGERAGLDARQTQFGQRSGQSPAQIRAAPKQVRNMRAPVQRETRAPPARTAPRGPES